MSHNYINEILIGFTEPKQYTHYTEQIIRKYN